MARTEADPEAVARRRMQGTWGQKSPSGVQGQSPWWEVRGQSSPKTEVSKLDIF